MTPIPNRLAQVPKELHDMVDMVLRNEGNYDKAVQIKRLYDQTVQIKRLYKVVDIAYRHGYTDGYRDSHTDRKRTSPCLQAWG